MTIEESDIGKRLDVFTSERMSVTRSAAQKLIEDGFVTVNDKKPAKNYRLKAGDESTASFRSRFRRRRRAGHTDRHRL